MNDSIVSYGVLNMERGKIEEEYEIDTDCIQIAENAEVADVEKDPIKDEYIEKREQLAKVKIVKQTWSISEIFEKYRENKLSLDMDCQRGVVWGRDKKTAFIESLFMDIIVPPIYVVEVPTNTRIASNCYEVVDGKQRLTTIIEFLTNGLRLVGDHLEYYKDIYGGKIFDDIDSDYPEKMNQMLSSVLDVYVITINSPLNTKYDIFARLNKGAEKLKVNEIRRAIYKSKTTDVITEYIISQKKYNKEIYFKVFSAGKRKHYDDYGRFYRSLAFFMRSNIELCVVTDYNSRPRDMINKVLQEFQNGKMRINVDELNLILKKTLDLMQYEEINKCDYIIDSIIPFCVDYDITEDQVSLIVNDVTFKETLNKSPATTSNVNKRLAIVKELIVNNRV